MILSGLLRCLSTALPFPLQQPVFLKCIRTGLIVPPEGLACGIEGG